MTLVNGHINYGQWNSIVFIQYDEIVISLKTDQYLGQDFFNTIIGVISSFSSILLSAFTPFL